MNQRPIWQDLVLAVVAWMVVQSLLRFTGYFGATVVVGLAGGFCSAIYGLRFDRERVAKVYAHPWGRPAVSWVCQVTNLQPPAEVDFGVGSRELRLKTVEDFAWGAEQVKSAVLGHDAVVDTIFSRLQHNVRLRGRSGAQPGLPPVGTFVLAGRRGIGKRTLATAVGEQLFSHGGFTLLDLHDYSDGEAAVHRLFGAAGRPGDLLQPVKRQPHHTIILENVEQASAKVGAALQELLMQGVCPDPLGGAPVSFQQCVVFLLTTATPLHADEPLTREQLVAHIADQTGCSATLLNLAQECLNLQSPDDLTKARVILQLFSRECAKYRLNLAYVEPEIVCEEVGRYSEASGFEHSLIRAARLLRDPIQTAASHELDTLVLTQDLLATPAIASSASAAAEQLTSNASSRSY